MSRLFDQQLVLSFHHIFINQPIYIYKFCHNKKKGEWIVGLGFTYNIGEQATIALTRRTSTLAGMRDVTPYCYQLGSLGTTREPSDYLRFRRDCYQHIQKPSPLFSPFIYSITYLYDFVKWSMLLFGINSPKYPYRYQTNQALRTQFSNKCYN